MTLAAESLATRLARQAHSRGKYHLFITPAAKDLPRLRKTMAQATRRKPERRRVERIALRLSATMRDGTRSKVGAKVIDMSTNGCRIECSSTVEDDSWIWLGIAGLETQYCRVVWHAGEFIGLQFEKPLSDAVFDRLLQEQAELPAEEIAELRSIASRTHTMARKAEDDKIAVLAELSRKCAVDAFVEGLRRR